MLLYVCAFLMATVVVGRQFPDNERYIILLEKGSDAGDIEELIQSMEVHASSTREEMQVRSLTSLLPFVFGNMSEATAEMVSKLPNVKLIEKDQVIDTLEDANRDSPLMDSSGFHRSNLDILDNKDCTDDYFTPFNYGLGVDIYVISSGINHDHIDFRWRNGTSGTRAKLGFDAIDDIYGTNEQGRDSIGTGTHFAGIAGGVDSGVAKDANLYSVRIHGEPPYYSTWATAISGMDAVSRLHDINSKRSNFIGSIAGITKFGRGNATFNIAANAAVWELWSKGIVTVVPVGNNQSQSCEQSLCGATYICVGAHGYDECTCNKKMLENSDRECIDVMAPGETILSASHKSNNSYAFMSGSYPASAHMAGIAAMMKKSVIIPRDGYFDIGSMIWKYSADDMDYIDVKGYIDVQRLCIKPKYN